jgi:hypothetical protein
MRNTETRKLNQITTKTAAAHLISPTNSSLHKALRVGTNPALVCSIATARPDPGVEAAISRRGLESARVPHRLAYGAVVEIVTSRVVGPDNEDTRHAAHGVEVVVAVVEPAGVDC